MREGWHDGRMRRMDGGRERMLEVRREGMERGESEEGMMRWREGYSGGARQVK